MIYGSVCSGIEAASVAWHPLGWRAAVLSEIDPFPRAVLKHHYPTVPLHGDFVTIKAGQYDAIDLLVGGTPCQSFSVAGLRAGLDDKRGNLALEFCKLARRLRPRWVVWENVPGVLSLEGGRAFASILGGLAECGYGLTFRVLDAQYIRVDGYARAVPQRRRRVFVVGYLGDWRRAAAVLFERESLQGHPAPRREAGQGIAPTLSARPSGGGGLGTDFDLDGGCIHTLSAARGRSAAHDHTLETYVPVSHTLSAKGGAGRMDYESETFIAHTLTGGGFDASEDGSGRGTPLVPVVGSLGASMDRGGTIHDAYSSLLIPAVAKTLTRGAESAGKGGYAGRRQEDDDNLIAFDTQPDWRVRRLTPVECERLQGFPDGYTNIPWRGKPEAPDGPRYKALGNSMACNVMRWIGARIHLNENLLAPIKCEWTNHMRCSDDGVL